MWFISMPTSRRVKFCVVTWVPILLLLGLFFVVASNQNFHLRGLVSQYVYPTSTFVQNNRTLAPDMLPLGYSQCPQVGIEWQLWKYLNTDVDCAAIFLEFLEYSKSKGVPQQYLTAEQRQLFTMQGRIGFVERFMISKMHQKQAESVWTRKIVDKMINKAKNDLDGFSPYPRGCTLIYRALSKFPIIGMKALVVGSITPWVEAIILSRGAREVVTQEYAMLRSDHPDISVVHPIEVAKHWEQFADFDVAVTYSSIEHSGLARYGDSLCADCDFLELKKLSCLVKPSGLLMLGVPVGKDVLVFNAHRIYGPIRLAILTANWKVEMIIDHRLNLNPNEFSEDYFKDNSTNVRQPIMVLRNQRKKKCYKDINLMSFSY